MSDEQKQQSGQAPAQQQLEPEPEPEPAPAQQATPTPASAPETPAAPDPQQAFLGAIRLALAKAGYGIQDGQVIVASVDPDGHGGLVRIEGADTQIARELAGVLLYSGDGREWKLRGVGPANLDVGGASYAFLHVSPLT